MQETRSTDEQIVKILRGADKTLVAEVAKRHGVDVTMYAWRKRFGRLKTVYVAATRSVRPTTLGAKRCWRCGTSTS